MTAPDYAWVGLAVAINAWWLIYDYAIAPRFGWPTMTGRMRYYLHETVAGPLIMGAFGFIVVAWFYHLFQHFSRQR